MSASKRDTRFASRFSATPLNRRLSLFALAALVGGLVGVATLLLIKLILLVQWIGYGDASEIRYASIAAAQPGWRLLLIITLGGLLVGVLMQWLPGKRYHGIADVMEACAFNSARMPVRSGLGAALAAGLSLGVGAPLGREGPAVHIGASLSAWIAEHLRLDRKQSLALLGCGAAAAVTVSFNAPIAAVIFALEVIVGYYTLSVFAPIVIAAMVAVMVRHQWLGAAPMFPIPDYSLHSLGELPLFAAIGVAGAVLARLLMLLVDRSERGWTALRVPRWCRPAGAGFLIGIMALEAPMILSVGFEPTLLAMRGDLAGTVIVTLLFAKLLAVGLAFGSGFAGGVFSPAMFLGAMLGGSVWLSGSLLPFELSAQGLYALSGIGAVASALLGAPISTILIVFEMSRDYGATLGVMTAAAFASTVMQLGEHRSFFRWQLARRKINLAAGRNLSLLMTHSVEPLVSSRYTRVDADCTVGELAARMGREASQDALFVDTDERLLGSVSLAALLGYAQKAGMGGSALDAALPADYALPGSTNLVTALQRMAEHELEYAPVVDDSAASGRSSSVSSGARVLGIVRKSDLLSAHFDVIKHAREEEFGVA